MGIFPPWRRAAAAKARCAFNCLEEVPRDRRRFVPPLAEGRDLEVECERLRLRFELARFVVRVDGRATEGGSAFGCVR